MSREAFQLAMLKARADWQDKLSEALIEHQLTGDIREETMRAAENAQAVHAGLATIAACPTRFTLNDEALDWPCMRYGPGVRCTHPECKP